VELSLESCCSTSPSALDPEMLKEVLDTMASLANHGMTVVCVPTK
jgi:ABC-type polar amino acid transport system ATPase subunit